MPKYTVEDVLEIIQNFTIEERAKLKAQLPNLLGNISVAPQHLNTQSLSQAFGDVVASGTSSVSIEQVASGNDTVLSNSEAQVTATSSTLAEALDLLKKLKADVTVNQNLGRLEKKNIEGAIEIAEEELKTGKPDQNLVDEAIEMIKRGLKGVQDLAVPVTNIADMIARLWITYI